MASALRAGRTTVVLLAMPAWPLGPPVAEALSACVGELDRLGYTPLVHFRHAAGPDGLTKACDRVRPVGLIAPAVDLTPERVESLRAGGTRAVVGLAQAPVEHVPSLAFSQPLVGEVALEHLAERGHRHVLALLPAEPSLAELGQQRLAGARAAAERHGVTLTAVPAGELRAGLAVEPSPTAVYAFNDEYALGAIDALPEGVALIGTDDSPAARLSHPRLTTIALVQAEAWEELARRLHALIEDEHADASPIVVAPKLIPGATT